MKLLNIAIAFGWIIIIIFINDSNLLRISICCGAYYIAELVFLFKQFLEQREHQARQLNQTLASIALDFLNK